MNKLVNGISGAAKLAGVIGWPVAHSLSPRLHGHWLTTHGIDGAYVPLPVHPDDLDQVVRTLPKLGFQGFNVTLPHKEAMARLVDRLEASASHLGAVNTVRIEKDGTLTGSNTDGFGFIESVREAIPAWAADVNTAVILGAGGAARSIAFALIEQGVKRLHIANRTVARAQQICSSLNASASTIQAQPLPVPPEVLQQADLLINTTALGMVGQPQLEIDLAPLGKGAIVADIVYMPLETGLLASARRRGLRTVDGLGMLLHQARAGF